MKESIDDQKWKVSSIEPDIVVRFIIMKHKTRTQPVLFTGQVFYGNLSIQEYRKLFKPDTCCWLSINPWPVYASNCTKTTTTLIAWEILMVFEPRKPLNQYKVKHR
jgi:hypothetical protein